MTMASIALATCRSERQHFTFMRRIIHDPALRQRAFGDRLSTSFRSDALLGETDDASAERSAAMSEVAKSLIVNYFISRLHLAVIRYRQANFRGEIPTSSRFRELYQRSCVSWSAT
jgi:hypothetical protein